jgi:hypothetical protein
MFISPKVVQQNLLVREEARFIELPVCYLIRIAIVDRRVSCVCDVEELAPEDGPMLCLRLKDGLQLYDGFSVVISLFGMFIAGVSGGSDRAAS